LDDQSPLSAVLGGVEALRERFRFAHFAAASSNSDGVSMSASKWVRLSTAVRQ
jgi:hypothetical protein